MPTYDYQCSNCGHKFEKFQSIMASPSRKCPECGKNTLKRLIGTGAGLIFKGSGFYITDYRSESYKDAAKADAKPAESKSGDGKAADSKPSDAKTGENKSSESKSSENKSPESKPSTSESAPAKPAAPKPEPAPVAKRSSKKR
jgi:putative FmdB family regulatory protein